MTRTVADAALLLTAMTGVDPRDRGDEAARAGKASDYAKALDAGALKGARIGVARKRYFGYSPRGRSRCRGGDRGHEGAAAR